MLAHLDPFPGVEGDKDELASTWSRKEELTTVGWNENPFERSEICRTVCSSAAHGSREVEQSEDLASLLKTETSQAVAAFPSNPTMAQNLNIRIKKLPVGTEKPLKYREKDLTLA